MLSLLESFIRHATKMFAVAYALVMCLAVLFTKSPESALDYGLLFMLLLIAIGVLGYAFSLRLVSRRIWQGVFVAQVPWSLYGFSTMIEGSQIGLLGTAVLVLLVMVVPLVLMFVYAFLAKSIWEKV